MALNLKWESFFKKKDHQSIKEQNGANTIVKSGTCNRGVSRDLKEGILPKLSAFFDNNRKVFWESLARADNEIDDDDDNRSLFGE